MKKLSERIQDSRRMGRHLAKRYIRRLLQFSGIDLTQNMVYDRQTRQILDRILMSDSNTVDVGCHEGEILAGMLRRAPFGKHFGFEPLPRYFQKLQHKYGSAVRLFSCALANRNGTSRFHFVKNAPAYSGIRERSYDGLAPQIERIRVELRRLDDVIPADIPIHFIKIDVEGGELDVLKGSERILRTYKPFVIFEFGLGASDYYGSTPEALFEYLSGKIGMKISLLSLFLQGGPSLTKGALKWHYRNGREYYFIAHQG